MTLNHSIALADGVSKPFSNTSPTWKSFTSRFLVPKKGLKNQAAVFVPAKLSGKKRRTENIEHVSLLVFDVDNKNLKDPIRSDNLCERVMRLKLDAVIHSTASHTNAHPRYRLIVRLKSYLLRNSYRRCAEELVCLLDIENYIDRTCLEPSRCYYLPTCSDDNLGDYESILCFGKPYDPSNPRAHLNEETKGRSKTRPQQIRAPFSHPENGKKRFDS